MPFADIHQLEAQLGKVAAEVRLAPVQETDIPLAGERVAAFFRELGERARSMDETVTLVQGHAAVMLGTDRYLTDEERGLVASVERVLRDWAPRFATLHAPETDLFVRSFPAFFRPYNDAVTRLVRSLLDVAAALRARLDEEAAEDAAAERWAERNPPLTGTEETVSLDEVLARLAAAG